MPCPATRCFLGPTPISPSSSGNISSIAKTTRNVWDVRPAGRGVGTKPIQPSPHIPRPTPLNGRPTISRGRTPRIGWRGRQSVGPGVARPSASPRDGHESDPSVSNHTASSASQGLVRQRPAGTDAPSPCRAICLRGGIVLAKPPKSALLPRKLPYGDFRFTRYGRLCVR
jgi:hypothetical protein